MAYILNLRDKGGIVKILLIFFVVFIAYELSIISINIYSSVHFTFISFLFIGLLSYLFWKEALSLLFVWIVFAGVFRKWILPGLSETIFLFNYVILAGIYIRFFLRLLVTREKITFKHPINVFLGFQLLWAIICMFNPQLPNPLVGILGLVIHFSCIPMLYIIPRVFNSKEELIKLFRVFIFMSIPVMILGLIQFFSPIDHPINQYVSNTGQQGIALVGNYPRVTSTFAYLSGYATYLSILIFVIIYLLSLKKSSFLFNFFLFVVLGFALINILATGSRGPTIITIACVLVYFILAGLLNMDFFRKFSLRLIMGTLIISLFFFFTPFGKNVFEAFMSRATSTEDLIPRLVDTYTTPFKFSTLAGIYGFGVGITYQGSEAVGNNLTKLQYLTGGFEEEPERIVIEMGVFGFILVYLIRILFIIFFWKLYRNLKDPDLKFLALISCLFQLQFLGLQSLFFNSSSLIFYWFALGFLFLLPKLDKQGQEVENKPQNNASFSRSQNTWNPYRRRF